MSKKMALFFSCMCIIGHYQAYANPRVNSDKESQFNAAIKKPSFTIPLSHPNLAEMHEASTLVVSCVDFRFRDEIENFLRKTLGLGDDYDEISIPGASLAFVTADKKNWTSTVDDIIKLLKDLHKIRRVIFIDHMGCGAYKILKKKEMEKGNEIDVHKKIFQEAHNKMKRDFPELGVYTLLMELDGTIMNVSNTQDKTFERRNTTH